MLKTLPQKHENFQIKNSDIFSISAQNTDCGYSFEHLDEAVLASTHNLWFLSRNKKNTPVNPSFTVQNWSLRGSKLYKSVFMIYLDMPFISSYGLNPKMPSKNNSRQHSDFFFPFFGDFM